MNENTRIKVLSLAYQTNSPVPTRVSTQMPLFHALKLSDCFMKPYHSPAGSRGADIGKRLRHAPDCKGRDHPRTGHEGPDAGGGGAEVEFYSFFNLGARWGWVVNATPRPPYRRESPGSYCTGDWVGLDTCGKISPYRDSIPGPSSP